MSFMCFQIKQFYNSLRSEIKIFKFLKAGLILIGGQFEF